MREGPRHRAELARALSISRGTITSIVQQLFEDGILEDGVDDSVPITPGAPRNTEDTADAEDTEGMESTEDTEDTGPPGPIRLKQKLGISARCGVFGHVAFRATSTIVAITALDGRVLAHTVQDRSAMTRATEWLDAAHVQFDELLDRLSLRASDVVHLHAAVNSQVDRLSGVILEAEVAGPWKGAQPRERLDTWTPHAEMTMENTARLLTLAESLVLGRREASLIRAELSWGIGMGHVFAGQIVTGTHGASGELGHVSIDAFGPRCGCGRRGCLWLFAGAGRVIEGARATLGPGAGLPEIARAAAAGDRTCLGLLTAAGAAVGEGLATVCNLLGPDVVTIGGELATCGQPLLAAIRARLMDQALPLTTRHMELRLSSIGEDPRAVITAGHSNLLNDAGVIASTLEHALKGPCASASR